MKKKNTSALICGSFDPITRGHLDIVKRASLEFERVYLTAFVNPEKKYLFSTDERLSFMKTATKELKNVVCDYNTGMVYEYVIEKDIDCIVKGVRNEEDLSYENEMARFNFEHSGRETIFYYADESLTDCSSSAVRDALKNGADLAPLLPEGIVEEVTRAYESKC
jgi:pantetheine-phosphate adenylyltransferase